MSGFINIAIKEKFDGSRSSRSHLTNKGKHILRQHKSDTLLNNKQKNFDLSRSHLNESLIEYKKPGETLNQAVDRFIKENEIEEPKRATSIRAVSGIISIPSEYLEDPEKLKVFKEKAKDFLETNEKLKGNVILAQTNFDETQPHIEFVFVPRDNENPKKLDYSKLYGTDRRKGYDGVKSLEKLHDEVAVKVGKPLGLSRGDGTHTRGLTNAEYMKSISDMKNDEKMLMANEIPEPPKPIQKPDDLVFNRGKIIELQQKEIKELRDYIKKTRNDRNLLRSSKGILKQAQARNKDRINLKNKIESQQAEIEKQKQIIIETFETDKPKPNDISAVRDKFKQMRRERELEEENRIKKENDKQDRLNQKRFIEDLEARNKLKKQLELEEEKRGVKKPAFRTPAYRPPGSNEQK